MKIGFISTRFAGTDGVSLESSKWAEVLAEAGHEIFWFCGLSDRPPGVTHLVPEAHFEHADIAAISDSVWGKDSMEEGVEKEVERLRELLQKEISSFVARFDIDVLIPQNSLTIPMNIPLGLAISDLIQETGIPAIAHHHDFYWERERFRGTAATAWLEEAFPPGHPSIEHVVINNAAKKDLLERFSLESTVIPNVMNFEQSSPTAPTRKRELREAIGLAPEDRLILQPTRIIPRKGIELSIELLARHSDPRNKLVISHASGDEGHDYLESLQRLASDNQVDLRLIGELITSEEESAPDSTRTFSLNELYPIADFITFPSLYEGFGNALLEAIYFRKPLLVNRYSVFREDIEPAGLELIQIDGEITDDTVQRFAAWLDSPPNPEKNVEIAKAHFGYDVLRERLLELLPR